jgi:hypothetical protein
MRRLLIVVVLLGGLGLGTLAWNAGQADAKPKKERHPWIHRALKDLRAARADLRRGAHDFGGHRVKALKATQVAIDECKAALKFDKK